MVIEKWEAINMLLHKECGKNEVFVGNINVIVQLDTEKDRFEKKGIKYMPTWHPAALLRDETKKIDFIKDLKKVVDEVNLSPKP